jgi:hypothetical protein
LATSAKPEIVRFSSAPQDGEIFPVILEIFDAEAILANNFMTSPVNTLYEIGLIFILMPTL